MMTKQFEVSIFSREVLLDLVEGLSEAQFNKIPSGFKNNIIWNLGHILVTQQILTYKFSGLKCNVSTTLIKKYTKGSAASDTISLDEINEIKNNLISTIKQTKEDYEKGVFKEYTEYTTSQGFSLKNVEDAIQFGNYHEGMHLGIIMSIKKLV